METVCKEGTSGKGQVQAPEGTISTLYDFPWEQCTLSSCTNKNQEKIFNSHYIEKFILKDYPSISPIFLSFGAKTVPMCWLLQDTQVWLVITKDRIIKTKRRISLQFLNSPILAIPVMPSTASTSSKRIWKTCCNIPRNSIKRKSHPRIFLEDLTTVGIYN